MICEHFDLVLTIKVWQIHKVQRSRIAPTHQGMVYRIDSIYHSSISLRQINKRPLEESLFALYQGLRQGGNLTKRWLSLPLLLELWIIVRIIIQSIRCYMCDQRRENDALNGTHKNRFCMEHGKWKPKGFFIVTMFEGMETLFSHNAILFWRLYIYHSNQIKRKHFRRMPLYTGLTSKQARKTERAFILILILKWHLEIFRKQKWWEWMLFYTVSIMAGQ